MSYQAILGTLIARTALHIGTGIGEKITDDLCRRDAAGNYMVPGTSIGGALRTLATRLAPRLGATICKALQDEWVQDDVTEPCGCMVCHLFGDINPGEGEREETGGRASRLFVAHAPARLPHGQTPRIRDGVGVDRVSRTAARASLSKFSLEILPVGTTFDLRLELEDASAQDEWLLAAVLAEWQAERAWLGGRVARGLGALKLAHVRYVQHDVSSADGVMDFLQSDTPWHNAPEVAGWCATRLDAARQHLANDTAWPDGVARSFVTIQFDLTSTGPLLTHDTVAAVRSGFDHAPLLSVIDQSGRPILPGASLRGVLRSHAERIARTLVTLETTTTRDFYARCPACNPVESRPDEALANCDSLLRVAQFSDTQDVTEAQLCLACRLFGSTRRGSRLVVEDAESETRVPVHVLDFLAIDRFTGGGKAGAKFDAIVPWKPVFKVRLHLENPRQWELGWLALVLRDLDDHMLTFGFGRGKGFGRAGMTAFHAQIGCLTAPDWQELLGQSMLPDTTPAGLYQCITRGTTAWHSMAQAWVHAFGEQCRDFRRQEKLSLKRDTYFDAHLATLYNKEAYQWLLKP